MENQILEKLQIKPGFKVVIENAPVNFNEVIGIIPNEVTLSPNTANQYDAILIFAITIADMTAALEGEHQKINQKTICWIIYPKTKTKLASDLNLMQSWEDLKRYNLSPCASAAINTIWTAIRIKPVDAQKKSGVGNAEIKQNDYGKHIDVENKVVTLPDDVKEALEPHPTATNFFEQLSYSNRKEYVLWIITAKQEKTRIDRIHKMIEKLVAGKKNPGEK